MSFNSTLKSLICFLLFSIPYFVQAQFTIDPESIEQTLEHGDSTYVDLVITNDSGETVVMDISGAGLTSLKETNVLALMNSVDENFEYPRTLDAINEFYPSYTLDEINTQNPNDLEAELAGKDVLLIIKQESCNDETFAAFGPVMQSFAENGGTVIFTGITKTETGTADGSCMFSTGLFDGNYSEFFSDELIPSLPDDPLLSGVGDTYDAPVATFSYDIDNEDAVRVVEYDEEDVVIYRNIGEGKVILIGHDYFGSNDDTKRIISNAIRNAGGTEGQWIYLSENQVELAAGESITIQVELNASTVYGGLFQTDLIVSDGTSETVVPVSLTVTGQPSFSLSTFSLDFGQELVGSNTIQTFDIVNPGTDSLFVTSIEIDDPVFTANFNTTALYGNTSQEIEINFNPADQIDYSATVSIYTNVAAFPFTLSLSGTGVGAPTTTVSPTEISVTLLTDETAQETISLTNTGEGPMDFTAVLGETNTPPSILFYTLGQEFIDPAPYTNLIDVVSSNFPDYALEETETTNASELEAALSNASIFIVPETDEFNTNILDVFSDFQNVLEAYMDAGGNIIFMGTFNNQAMFGSGLFTGESSFDVTGAAEVLEDHPLTQNLSGIISSVNNQMRPFLFAPAIEDLIYQSEAYYGFGGGTILGYEEFGTGNAVYIGYAMGVLDENNETMVINALNWLGGPAIPTWITFGPESGTAIPFPNGADEIIVDLNAEGLLGGTYTAEIIIENNDPLNPTVVIPITMVVVGVPAIEMDTNPYDFGNVVIGNTPEYSFVIDNPGTDSLFVVITPPNDGYIIEPGTNITVPPLSSVEVTVSFVPTIEQDYSGTLVIANNVEDQAIELSGIGIGAPSLGIDPESIEVTLLAGDSTTETITVSNSGAGPLDWSVPAAISTSDVLEILVLKQNTEIFASNAIIDAISQTGVDNNITEFDLNDGATELESLISDIDVIVLPYTFVDGALNEYQAIFEDFVQLGGSFIATGTTCTNCLNSTGLMLTDISEFSSFGTSLTTVDSMHPLAETFEDSYLPSNFNFVIQDFDNAMTTVMTGSSYYLTDRPVVAYSFLGAGKVMYLGYQYTDGAGGYGDQGSIQMMENALNWSTPSLTDWLSVSPGEGIVEVGENGNIDITIDATGLLAGVYTFNVLIETNDPLNPIILVPVTMTVEAFPQAAFGGTMLSCDGTAIFFDNSVNDPTSWSWDFGDGMTSTDENPSHIYETEGEFNVSLEVCNDIGCDTQTINNFIEVDFAQVFCDTLLMTTNSSETIGFCNGVLLDSGGENNYTDNTNSITTIAPQGAVSITLEFSEFNMDEGYYYYYGSSGDYIEIYDGADASGNLLGTFTGTALPNGDGIVTSPTGIISVRQVSDFFNTGSGFIANWTCANPTAAPIAAGSGQIVTTCQGQVQFSDESTEFPQSWSWNFGDGNGSEEQNPEHFYESNGTYTVTVEACNVIGCNTTTFEIELSDVFEIDVDIPEEITPGVPTIFQDNSPGAVGWEWDFGDGNIAFGIASPITVYTDIGAYDVSLTVIDAAGCERVKTFTVYVGIVGINDPSIAKLELYPNPNQGQFNIAYEFQSEESISLNVIDAQGKIVSTYHAIASGKWQYQMDLSHLAKGLYHLRLKTSSGSDIGNSIIIQ